MNISLDKNEVLRYLGYQGQALDERTDQMIDDCIDLIQRTAKPRYLYRIFDIRVGEGESIELVGTNLILRGRDIYEHLRECRRCAVMAATLGVEADNLIRVSENTAMTQAVILDACATEYIEKLCDLAEDEISQLAADEKRGINWRFSPGYGDLALKIQNQVVTVLDATRKIGLTVTENSLMIPRKSVTAFIGFTTNIRKKKTSRCATCSMRGRCKFTKEGTTCGR